MSKKIKIEKVNSLSEILETVFFIQNWQIEIHPQDNNEWFKWVDHMLFGSLFR